MKVTGSGPEIARFYRKGIRHRMPFSLIISFPNSRSDINPHSISPGISYPALNTPSFAVHIPSHLRSAQDNIFRVYVLVPAGSDIFIMIVDCLMMLFMSCFINRTFSPAPHSLIGPWGFRSAPENI